MIYRKIGQRILTYSFLVRDTHGRMYHYYQKNFMNRDRRDHNIMIIIHYTKMSPYIFSKILIGLSTVACAAVQRIHDGRRSKYGARSTRRVRWRPGNHSEMWSELLQRTTRGKILGRHHQRFGRQWLRMIILLPRIVYSTYYVCCSW